MVSSIVAMKQAQNAAEVQYAVAAKIMQTQKSAGASVIKLINAATQNVSNAGDQLVAAATGLGGSLDVAA